MPTVAPDIQQFVDAVGATQPDLESEQGKLFRKVFRRGNYFRHPGGFLIVKISRVDRPFWGLGKQYVDFLNDALDNYYLVLLDSASSGYVFSKDEINSQIKRGNWRLSKTDYKINMPLPTRNAFRTTEQFSSRIDTSAV